MSGFLSHVALTLGLLTLGCTQYDNVGTDTVDPSYATGGGEWRCGGGITTVARVFERDGVAVVCGAWTTDSQSTVTSELNEDVMEAASTYIGKTRIVQNLAFMNRVRYSDNIAGAQANCVASTVPWRPEFAATPPRLRFPAMVFPLGKKSGDNATFRQSRRPMIVR